VDEHMLIPPLDESEILAFGDGHRRMCLKMFKLFDEWLDGANPAELTTEPAFRLFDMLGKSRECAELCDIRMQQFKIDAARRCEG